MTDHLRVDVIAVLDEGLLDPGEAEQARLHLRSCSLCAGHQAALAGVPAALRKAGESEPPPLPAWVAARLDAALAAEAEAGRAAAAADRLTSIAGARPRRSRPGRGRGALVRSLAAAAAVCLLGGGGYALFRAAAQPPSAGSTSAGARSGAASKPAPRGGPLIEPGATAPAIRVPRVTHSGTNYRPGQLQAQVESVLGQTPRTGQPAPGESSSSPGMGLPTALQGCVQKVIGAQQPTLVDTASYQGQPATVIVAPQPNGPGGQVWVAGAGCSASHGDVLAHTAISSIP